jgi:hypothetical protein
VALLLDGFQRLLAHGIAQFHGFRSVSRLAWPGETVFRLLAPGEANSTAASSPCPANAVARVFVVRQQRNQVGSALQTPWHSSILYVILLASDADVG